MREYYLDPRLCSIYINPKVDVDVSDIDLLVIEPHTREDLLLVLKSMEDGIPVISLRTNYSVQIIANGITGLLYNLDHERDKLVEYMKNDPATRMDIGQTARHWVLDNADLTEWVHNMWESDNGSN